MSIKQIGRKTLDTTLWNALVDKYAQGLPYAYSWYLDAVCDDWSVFVKDDFEAGMAFQVKKKKALAYSLQPFLTQQLGFLGNNTDTHLSMIKKLRSKVFYINHHFFFFNHPKLKLENRINYELNLNKDYDSLYQAYKTNTKRNLKKAINNNITISTSKTASTEDIDFILKHSKIDFNADRIVKLKRLVEACQEHGVLELYQASSNHTRVALVLFVRTQTRSVYLIAASSSEGLSLKANFMLVDAFVKKNSQQEHILDFEGSSIEGISRFYKGFGASENNYTLYKTYSFKRFFFKLF